MYGTLILDKKKHSRNVTIFFLCQDFVAAVERLCFGDKGQLHGTRVMNRTQIRACLAVGSLSKALHRDNQVQRAERLAERLESWLDHHGKGELLRIN